MPAFLTLTVIALLAVAYVKITHNWRVIKNPRWGILDLTAGDAAALIAADKAALQDVFPSPQESSGDVPKCDVLFLYAHLSEEGRIEDYARGFREIIRDSGAREVVVVSDRFQGRRPDKVPGWHRPLE